MKHRRILCGLSLLSLMLISCADSAETVNSSAVSVASSHQDSGLFISMKETEMTVNDISFQYSQDGYCVSLSFDKDNMTRLHENSSILDGCDSLNVVLMAEKKDYGTLQFDVIQDRKTVSSWVTEYKNGTCPNELAGQAPEGLDENTFKEEIRQISNTVAKLIHSCIQPAEN